MSKTEPGPIPLKRWILIGGSACTGIGIFLYRRYYENGEFTKIDLFAVLSTVIMFTIIGAVMTHIAKRKN